MAATWQMTTVDHTARHAPNVGRFRAKGANRQQAGTPPRAAQSASAEHFVIGKRITRDDMRRLASRIPYGGLLRESHTAACFAKPIRRLASRNPYGGLLREAALRNHSRRRAVSRSKPPPPVVEPAEDHTRAKEGSSWNSVTPADVIASPFGGLRQGAKPPYAGLSEARLSRARGHWLIFYCAESTVPFASHVSVRFP